MMKAVKKLSELTLEELHKKSKKLKAILVGIAVVWTIIIGISIGVAISLFKQDKIVATIPLLMTPMLCLTTLLPLIIQHRKLKEEINARKRQ